MVQGARGEAKFWEMGGGAHSLDTRSTVGSWIQLQPNRSCTYGAQRGGRRPHRSTYTVQQSAVRRQEDDSDVLGSDAKVYG